MDRISTNAAALAVTGLRARYNERGDFLMTTTPPISESSAPPIGQLFFPQLAVGGGFSARLILFSLLGTASGTVTFVSQSGLPWAVATQWHGSGYLQHTLRRSRRPPVDI